MEKKNCYGENCYGEAKVDSLTSAWASCAKARNYVDINASIHIQEFCCSEVANSSLHFLRGSCSQ